VNNLRSPDVVALEEIQDNTGPADDGVVAADQTLAELIAAIKAAGGPDYAYREIDPVNDTNGGEPGGNIRSVLLFKKMRGLSFIDRGTPSSTTGTQVVSVNNIFGKHADLTLSPGLVDPANTAFDASRKPLVGEFSYWGKQFFVVANHFNSKGGDQPLLGRFQPPNRVSEDQRHAQATILRGFIEQIQAIDPFAAIAVVGDLNDFQFSATADILVGANKSLTDLPRTLPAGEQYTYVFQGNSQVLDHIMLSKPLTFFADYDIVHINAEFAAQASDHDPQIVRLGVGNTHWLQRFTPPA
jgi:predicted extracellular nuclease